MRGVRLLVVADSSTTHTHRWAHWARDAGAVVTVLSPYADPIEGVRVVKFPPDKRWYHRIPKARMLLDLLPFRRVIREIDPQLIHFHFVSEGGRAFYWDNVRVPMVASTWGQDVIWDRTPTPREVTSLTKMLGRCRIVTATTHQLARETARYMAADRPIYVIPFGVDLSRFPIREGEAPSEPSSDRPVTLGFVKWLKPKYGPDVTDPLSRELLTARLHKQITLLQEQIMREGKQANGYAPLLENEMSPETWRFKLGTLIREQPAWVGQMYAYVIRALGEYQRSEWVRRNGGAAAK
jgi:glycosyltransferase involved in cell wall biosynthesis